MVVISVLLRIRRLLIATTFCRHIPLVKRRSGLPSRRAQKHPQRAAPTRRVMRDCVLNKKKPTFEQPLFLGLTFDLSPLYEECSRRVVRPFCVVDFLAGLLDSSQQRAPRIGLYLPPQNHAKRRILCQYTICRDPACLIDLTAIPDGHCRKAVGTNRRNLHFLRDPGSRDPYIDVTVACFVPLWVAKRLSCGDGQYQERCRYFYQF